MSIPRLRVGSLYGGVPYAYASIAPAGALVFTAGACPLDGHGTTVGPGDIPAQTRQALANLTETLRAAGVRLTDVVKTTVYVATESRAGLVAARKEVQGAFGAHDAPSTLLGVTALGYPDQLVKIEAVAARVAPGTRANQA